eukprot:354212_1
MSTPTKTLPLDSEEVVDADVDRRCSSPPLPSATNDKSLQFSKCFNNTTDTDTDQASSVDIPRWEVVSDLELHLILVDPYRVILVLQARAVQL